LFWLGGGLSWDGVDFPDYPESVQGVVDKDFPNPVVAPDTAALIISDQVNSQNATRVHFMVSRRDIVFTRRRRLDAVDAIQDVRLGTEIVATVAPSIGILEVGDNPADDIYGRLEFFGGNSISDFFWTVNASVEGNLRKNRENPDDGNWKDVITEVGSVLFWQPLLNIDDPGRHTLVLKASWERGRLTTRPFQLTLGGRDGVRGYSRDAFPGGNRVLLTIEERLFVGWPDIQLFDVGAAAFVDVGRMWSEDAPFGVDSGWKGALGVSLLLGSPSGSDKTTRIEFTLPFDRSIEADPTYFRFYVDLGGVLRGFSKEQVDRSRYSGVSSDLVNRPRRGS
jgi:hypothetical protein